jgi:hypothetical protein
MGFAWDGGIILLGRQDGEAFVIHSLYTVYSLGRRLDQITRDLNTLDLYVDLVAYVTMQRLLPYWLALACGEGSFQAILHADLHFQQTSVQRYACASADVG